MKKLIVVIFLQLITMCVFAQTTEKSDWFKRNTFADLALSFNADQFVGAVSSYHLHGFGKGKQRFKVGYGLRFTSYVGANKQYTTAPSKYTSPVQGPGTIFSENIDSNIDTIAIQTPQVNALNLAIYLQYTIGKFDLGFNIDAAGFSFGSNKQANIISSSFDPGQSPVQEARPTTWNLLLTSDNDIGSLNSEFFLRYWLTEKIGIKAGYTFLFTEYRTGNTLSFNNGSIENDRFRLKSSMAMIGINYSLFK